MAITAGSCRQQCLHPYARELLRRVIVLHVYKTQFWHRVGGMFCHCDSSIFWHESMNLVMDHVQCIWCTTFLLLSTLYLPSPSCDHTTDLIREHPRVAAVSVITLLKAISLMCQLKRTSRPKGHLGNGSEWLLCDLSVTSFHWQPCVQSLGYPPEWVKPVWCALRHRILALSSTCRLCPI